MLQLILDGGVLFTVPITMIAAIVLILLIQNLSESSSSPQWSKRNKFANSLGLFALVFGILGQLLGLMDGLSAIQHAGGISPAMLAGGIYTSSISTMFGLVTFIIARLGTIGLRLRQKEQA